MRMLEYLIVGSVRIDSNEFCWKVAGAAFWWGMRTSPSQAGMKIVLHSIHLVIQSYLTFSNIPISSGWQGGFLGHRYKLLSPQRAHCTELHKRLSREISRWVSIVLLLLWKKKPAIFVTLHTSKTCESPIPPSHHTARCNWKKASALHGEWDTAGWQLAGDTSYLSFIGCCKTRIRLNYFQQSAKDTSLAFAWRNLLHDQRTEGWTASKHRWKEAQNHRLAGIKSWPACAQEDNQLAESVWHWNWSTPFPFSCYELRRNLQVVIAFFKVTDRCDFAMCGFSHMRWPLFR